MSPLTVRRYRAERLLRSEFEGLQGRVLGTVTGQLRATGVELDTCDLEGCYALAWQGLYTAVLEGQEIVNPAGWLVTVTFRRAIDEHRARIRAHRGGDHAPVEGRHDGDSPEPIPALERDLAGELDDRARLRQVFEGLRARLSEREREAAVLCYLQGLPRAQAAARMGVSEARMRKLMEGAPGRPGVAGKVGALVQTIRDGGWCEEQGSLMRGLAFGILDPNGERYQLAQLHRGECPSCRAYVATLRGLGAVLPPVLLPGGLGAAAMGIGAASSVGASAGAGAHAGAGAQAGVRDALSGAGSTAGPAAGAGGAMGGGWLVAGTGKLALGCALALSVGTGCIALNLTTHPEPARHHRLHARASAHSAGFKSAGQAVASIESPHSTATTSSPTATTPARLSPGGKASREFGPEGALSANAASVTTTTQKQLAHTSSTAPRAQPSGATELSSSSASSSSSGTTQATSAAARAATREFSPG